MGLRHELAIPILVVSTTSVEAKITRRCARSIRSPRHPGQKNSHTSGADPPRAPNRSLKKIAAARPPITSSQALVRCDGRHIHAKRIAPCCVSDDEPPERSGALKTPTGMARNKEMAQLDRTGRMHRSDNNIRQRLLAESLVATLGREGAVHACHSNTWDGVLAYVLSVRTPAKQR